MYSDELASSKRAKKPEQTDRLTWGLIELQVTNIERAVVFWTEVLGFTVMHQFGRSVTLGTQKKPMVVLHPGARKHVQAAHLGLYHFAIGLPDQVEFSRVLARLISLHIPVSLVDHLGSKAIYLSDPDGFEIEFTLETPERFSHYGDMSRGLVLFGVDGQKHNGRQRLDVQNEVHHAHGTDLKAPFFDDAYLAHMHFNVDDLAPAQAWFEQLGFAKNLLLPKLGFADMGAGSAITHRLAMNTWAGPNLLPAPSDMSRLTHYTLHANDPEVMNTAVGLELAEFGLSGKDPSGTPMSWVPAF